MPELIIPDYSFLDDQPSTDLNAAQPDSAFTNRDREGRFFDAMTTGISTAGVPVNNLSILNHPPVWQALNILSGDLGQVNWSLTTIGPDGREEAHNHPAQIVLEEPNDFQEPAIWKETMMQYALWGGNALSPIQRIGSRVVSLGVPIHPAHVHGYDILDGELMYEVSDEIGARFFISSADTFHIRGLTADGIWGHSLIKVAKGALGHGLALQLHGNSTFRNGARPGVVLTHPGNPSTEARENLRREWNEIHRGAEDVAKVAILCEGMGLEKFSFSNEDTQWIDARRLDRTFVASLFNLPAYKLNALEDSTVRANLEQQNRDYLLMSLARWFNQFSEQARRKLLNPRERRDHSLQFFWNLDEFLKGDFESRMKGYNLGISSKVLKPNEARKREGLPPDPDGDKLENPNTVSRNNNGNGENVGSTANQAFPPQKLVAAVQQELETGANRELVQDAVARLFRAEETRVMQCGRSKNFLQALETFYESDWPALAAKIVGPVARAVRLGESHCDDVAERHARMSQLDAIDVSGQVNADGLEVALRALCERWQTRLDQYASDLLGESE